MFFLIVKITITLAILCIIATILSLPAFVPVEILDRPYTMFTSIFVHSGYVHLFYNLFGLLLFGFIAERLIGWKWYTILILVSIGFSEIGYIFLSNPFIGAVGISGVIYGIMGLIAALKPKMIVYTPYGPLPMVIAIVIWAAVEILMLGANDMVGHSAHLFGLIGGILFGLFYKYNKIFSLLLLISIPVVFLLAFFLPHMPVYTTNCQILDREITKTFTLSEYNCNNTSIIGFYEPNYKLSIDKQISFGKRILSNFGNFSIDKIMNNQTGIFMYGKINSSKFNFSIENYKYWSLYLIKMSP